MTTETGTTMGATTNPVTRTARKKPVIKPLHGAPKKLWVMLHVIGSVGWLGVVVSVLGLATVGLAADDADTAETAYDSAVLLADTFFLPAAILMFVSGVVLGLGTKWGLFRYYWVTVKFLIGCALLVAGTYTLTETVRSTAALEFSADHGPKIALVGMLAVIAALMVVSAVLSVAKPWGRIRRRTTKPAPQNQSQES